MPYKITLRSGHPRKRFRRDGREYTEGAPVVLDELSPPLKKELAKPGSWLVCEELDAEEAAQAQQEQLLEEATSEDLQDLKEDLGSMKMAELKALAERVGLDVSGLKKKADIITALRVKVEAGTR